MIKIRQATKQGWIEMVDGGVADLGFPNSKTRRGRVCDKGLICPTIIAESMEIYRIERNNNRRKDEP